MENMKKYEMYTNKKRTGVLSVFVLPYKKALSMSIAGILALSSLSGCKLVDKNVEPTTYQEIIFDNIDDEINAKFSFVDDSLNEISVEQLNNLIMEPYKKARSIEFDLEPKNNEYFFFYTEEDITSKKNEMVSNLNECIRVIEKYTGRRFEKEEVKSK